MRRAALMAVVFVGFVCFVGGLLAPRANAQGSEDVTDIVVPYVAFELGIDDNVLFAEGWCDSYFDYLNSADIGDYLSLDEDIYYSILGPAPPLDDAAFVGDVIAIAGARKTAKMAARKVAPAKKTPSPASPAAPKKTCPTKKRAR